MKDIQTLISIANALELKDKAALLSLYQQRLADSESPIVVPVVGEYSSGKTTLINALLDHPGLETATRATTASIFEVRFGADSCHAEVVDDEGNVTEIEDITNLRNEGLRGRLVRVYDTSTRLGNDTVLVDTPGLSSSDPNHRIALTEYLPNADAVLVLTDINQQLTRSTLDFINTSRLAGRRIYGVITKTDTKTAQEVEQARQYMQQLEAQPFDRIIAISVKDGDLAEFDELMQLLSHSKRQLIAEAIEGHVQEIAAEMAQILRQMIDTAQQPDNVDQAIADQQRKLRDIDACIDRLIADAADCLDENMTHSVMEFRKQVFQQIDSIVKTMGRECDAEVHAAVNNTGAIMLHNFQRDVLAEILRHARKDKSAGVPTDMLETVCVADRAFNGFTYDINLAAEGHKRDKSIGYGILAVTAIVAIAVTGGAASAAVGGSGASTGAVIAADAATDAAAAAYTVHRVGKMTRIGKTVVKTAQIASDVKTGIDVLHASSDKMGQRMGMKRGLLETSVGWVTEFFAKPQRQRAVSEYVDNTLTPEYQMLVSESVTSLINEIDQMLHRETQDQCQQIIDNLESLRTAYQEDLEAYNKRIETLKSYLKLLQ